MYKYFIISILFCFSSSIIEGARWARTGDVNTRRSGSESAMFTDGRIITISGMEIDGIGMWSGDGFQNYEIFNPATGEWTQGSLSTGGEHTLAMLLPDGTVFWTDNDGNTRIFNPRDNSWSSSANFSVWRWRACGTLLKDGRVLIVGQDTNKTCLLYDWGAKTITPTTSSNYYHNGEKGTSGQVEVLLPDGKVLLIGGRDSLSCEIYDPAGQTWTNTGSLITWRRASAGIYLRPPWNKVLVAGGLFGGAETELWDPLSGTWSATDNLNATPRIASSMVLLPNGKAMIMGGCNRNLPTLSIKKCEIFDPDLEQWTLTDSLEYSLRYGRSHFPAAVLYTGRVLAISGHDSVAQQTAINRYGLNYTCEIYDPSDGIVDSQTPLTTARFCHTATVLPILHTQVCSTNILVAGGENSGGILNSCELYNYNRNEVVFTGNLNVERTRHTAILLPAGTVLAAGGRNSGGELNSCEIYDASTEQWTLTNNLNQGRFNHTATLLKDGRVLATGGEASSSYLNVCEIYNPVSNTWTLTNPMNNARAEHSAILLFDGRVLVIGGQNSGGTINSCEIWDPGTGNWINTGSLSTARRSHTTVLLQSGKILAMGGINTTGNALSSCEIYTPANGTWASETPLNSARYWHNSVLLYSGLVLAIGGYDGTNPIQTWEVYDPATHTWKQEGTFTGRYYNSSSLVPSDKPYVIMIGGNTSGGAITSIERYDIGLGYHSDWQSTITSHPSVTTIRDSMHITGTLFREYSEADGGNHCHIVSSDHPIISLVRIGGGNWQGNGGGDMIYMPLSSNWNETQTDVILPDTASGYYRLWAIVNGIPSKWYNVCANTEETTSQTLINPRYKVYPNPATTKISFDLTPNNKEDFTAVIDIYDCSGRPIRMLRTNTLKSKTINLEGLESGIYFYIIKQGKETNKGKFVILNK